MTRGRESEGEGSNSNVLLFAGRLQRTILCKTGKLHLLNGLKTRCFSILNNFYSFFCSELYSEDFKVGMMYDFLSNILVYFQYTLVFSYSENLIFNMG